MDGVNSPYGDAAPVVSDDEREIFFSSDRGSSGTLPLDIFVATRATADVPFETPVALPGLSTKESYDWPVWLSPDRCTLYYINKLANFATLRVAHR